MSEQGASVVSFTLNKNSKKWIQTLLRYLKKATPSQKFVCFANSETLSFGLESISKDNRVILKIAASNLADYIFNAASANKENGDDRGYLFSLPLQVFKTFLATIQFNFQVSISETEFTARSTLATSTSAFTCYLLQNQEEDIFKSIELVDTCSMVLNSQNNSIIESMEAIVQNFKIKSVEVDFKSIDKSLECKLDRNMMISTITEHTGGIISEPKRYPASMFSQGFSNLSKAERLELSFTRTFAIFAYHINASLQLYYYVTESAEPAEQ